MSETPYKPASFNKALVFISEGNYLPRIVVTAASMNKEGSIVTGTRHCCPLMRKAIKGMKALGEDWTPCNVEEGYVDQWGNYLSKDEALEVVLRNKQPLSFIDTSGTHSTLGT